MGSSSSSSSSPPPSSSDRHVSARAILRALAQVQRWGEARAMRRLEELEPDLAEFVLERLSLVHRHLHALGAPPKRTDKAYQQVQLLVFVAVEALRQSQLELWAELTAGEQRLATLGAAAPPAAPAAADATPGSSPASPAQGQQQLRPLPPPQQPPA